jgi:hypothetical protein
MILLTLMCFDAMLPKALPLIPNAGLITFCMNFVGVEKDKIPK